MEEVETVKCPNCGHDVPKNNMAIHQPRCNYSRNTRTNTLSNEGSDDNSPPRSKMRLSHPSLPLPSSPSRNGFATTSASMPQPVPLTTSPAVASMPSRSEVLDATDSQSVGLRRRRIRGGSIEENSNGIKANGLEDESEVQEVQVVDLAGDDDDGNDDDDSDSIEAEWGCPRCTLLNPLSNDRCEACHYRYRDVASSSTGDGRGMRRPDPVRREALIGDTERLQNEINTFLRQFQEDDRRENTVRRDNDNSNGDNHNVLRSIGGSAIIGSGIAAASAYVRGGNIRESALQGALVGAVGGAFTSLANSPPPHISHLASLPVRERTFSTNPGTFTVMMRRRHTGMAGDAIDNMSYDRLLEVFGDGSENRGAEMSTIQSLPSATLKDVEKELPEEQRQCAICLEAFQNGQTRRSLPCLHGFHEECIDRWLQSNAVCPICKHHI